MLSAACHHPDSKVHTQGEHVVHICKKHTDPDITVKSEELNKHVCMLDSLVTHGLADIHNMK